MLALGIILILLSAGSLVAVLASGTDDKSMLFGSVTMPTLVVFLAGAATLLIFIMGLELFRSGVRRANQSRKTKKKLRTLEKREEKRSGGGTAGEPVREPVGETTRNTRTDRDRSPTEPVRTSGDEPHQTPPPDGR